MNGGVLRTLIVDDEPVAAQRLRVLSEAIDDLRVVGIAGDGIAAIAAIERLSPQLVLLDIAMPGLDGIEVARAVGALPSRPAIAFCTAYDQHALAAFEVGAFDYLLKPISRERLSRSISRLRAFPSQPATLKPRIWIDDVWVPHRGVMHRLPVADIDRIEAERDYVRLWAGSSSYLLHETISRLESRLDPESFVRLRRSVIARRSLLTGLRHDGLGIWSALLSDGSAVRIGPTFLAGVKMLLLNQSRSVGQP